VADSALNWANRHVGTAMPISDLGGARQHGSKQPR
jgi:hypothetical protein